MTTVIGFGAAQSRFVSLLDDATRRAVISGHNAVALTGALGDLAVLGLMSLYRSEPVHTYAAADDTNARAAALRFGALHQGLSTKGAAPEALLRTLAERAGQDGVNALTGHRQPLLPTPLSDPEIDAFWRTLPPSIDPAHLTRTALLPLLGQKMTQGALVS
ncbi:hypothetical protein [uncultured Roseobacter sp.]|uniref:hypothetical protein n=1 Tax=uncultured Roseobacter sp. TaxID=114847 RepID=UPI002601D9DE|nr:hypothetical protein [uncultured Roseobacter sp.]